MIKKKQHLPEVKILKQVTRYQNRINPVHLPVMSQHKTSLTKTAVVILAAGFSGRMGVPKLSLPFDENQTFVQKIVQTYHAAGCEKIVLVVNQQGKEKLKQNSFGPAGEKVSVVLNPFPERERFYSLQTGLKSLREFTAVFIQNIDNPFVQPGLLLKLDDVSSPKAYVVPQYHGRGGHPVLLSKQIVRDLVIFPDYRENLRDFLHRYTKINCPVEDEKILVNINSREEYRKYFKATQF